MWLKLNGLDLYLIECPFCGRAKLDIVSAMLKNTNVVVYRVSCLGCYAIGPGELNEIKAVSTWNRRV